MEWPPGLESTILNLITRLPNTQHDLIVRRKLISMFLAHKKQETPKTTRKRPSNQNNDRKETKESAKKPKKHQFNKTENSKDKSTLIECLLVFEERKCYICKTIFDKTSTFVNHLREHNNLCCMVELEEGQLRNVVQCALCVKTFTSNGYATRHVNTSHKAIKEICDSDTFIPKKQTPYIHSNNPPPIAESSNATAIQPTGQTLVTNNQNGGVVMGSSLGFCFGCRMRVPFVDYKAHMATNNNKNVPGEGECSTNNHMAAHMNYQGNVKEEVSIERNVQEAAKETKFIPKTVRINPLPRCPPMNINYNDMEKEFIKRNNAQRSNVSYNVRSMSETTVVPGNNYQPCTTSEREIVKGDEGESFATNSNNSKVSTGYNNNFYNEMVRALKEIFRQETVEENVDEVIDITGSDDEDVISQLKLEKK